MMPAWLLVIAGEGRLRTGSGAAGGVSASHTGAVTWDRQQRPFGQTHGQCQSKSACGGRGRSVVCIDAKSLPIIQKFTRGNSPRASDGQHPE